MCFRYVFYVLLILPNLKWNQCHKIAILHYHNQETSEKGIIQTAILHGIHIVTPIILSLLCKKAMML